TASGGGSYPYGSSVTLLAVPATGYEFVNWTESGSVVSTQESYVFTVTADRILVANFQLITLQVTAEINPVEGGTVDGGGSYPYGSSVTLLAVPAADYEFVNWTIEDVEVSTTYTYTFTVTENTVVRANFALITLTVTVVAEPADKGTVTGGGDYLPGETVVVAAAPADGHKFYHWTNESNEVVSDENPYSFTVVENISLKGIFGTVSIGESEVPYIELYPNPVGDYLYVEFRVELSESAVVSLYDVSGKVLANYKGSHLFKDVLELKTSHLKPGIYFIKITDIDTDTRFTGKVIKR
ncbi:MAG: T9SS type A sorting domain-containing protein, partial [Bacteroidota bacterium]|nr:T9SS type A sorting domain-containing protein [Bacteroidota bacterium]